MHRDCLLGMGGIKGCRQGQKLKPNNKTNACHAQDFPKPIRVKYKGWAISKWSLTPHQYWLIYSKIKSAEDLNPVNAPVWEILLHDSWIPSTGRWDSTEELSVTHHSDNTHPNVQVAVLWYWNQAPALFDLPVETKTDLTTTGINFWINSTILTTNSERTKSIFSKGDWLNITNNVSPKYLILFTTHSYTQ